LFEYGNIRISIFPEIQKLLIGRATLDEISGQEVSPPELKLGQGPDGLIRNETAMRQNFLKFSGCSDPRCAAK
jgi:hypothetical protein